MSYDTFLKVLQSIITMTDANSPESIKKSKEIVEGLYQLIASSGMADILVTNMAADAVRLFNEIIMFKDDFAGVPGQIRRNKAKRDRLAMMIYPHC